MAFAQIKYHKYFNLMYCKIQRNCTTNYWFASKNSVYVLLQGKPALRQTKTFVVLKCVYYWNDLLIVLVKNRLFAVGKLKKLCGIRVIHV